MKSLSIIIIVVLQISACKNKANDPEIVLKKHLITERIFKNKDLESAIEDNAGRSTNPAIVNALQKSKEVSSWREKYYGNQSIENLISYSDSIINKYISLEKVDVKIINGMRGYRQMVHDEPDSANVVNLNLYTLFAENAILDDYLRQVSIFCRMGLHMPFSSSLGDSAYSYSDTVLLIVNTMVLSDEWRVNFDNVTCRNEDTGICINPYVTKIQNYFLLRYLPKEKGKYVISGQVVFSTYDYEDEVEIMNRFVVE